MSGLLGIKGQTAPPNIAGLRMATSLYSLPIPIVYGQARITGNLIHFPQPPTVQNGSKIARRTKGTQATARYFAPVVVALCEGQIAGIGQVWSDKQSGEDFATIFHPAGWSLFNGGSDNSAPWTYLSSNFPLQALYYPGVAYVVHQSLELPNGSIQNYSWEINGLLQVGSGIVDANPKDIITDFLTNVDHGLGWPTSKIADLTGYANYCKASGLFLSPAVDQQQAAKDYLDEWLNTTCAAAVWSDGKLKIVPYADTAITGNGVTYTPNVTPQYDLTDDNFLAPVGTDPVRCTRKKPAQCYNQLYVEFEDRTMGYAPNVAEAKIEADILANGLRPAPKLQLRGIKDFSTARYVAQLLLQRMNAIRDTYEFELGMQFSLLEVMDIVTLTDAGLGLNRTPVRITQITELDDELGFEITAEEMLIGTASASRYSVAGVYPNPTNQDIDPGNTFAPVIFEGPTSPAEIWIAASGGVNWGGCEVWVSTDGLTYYLIGRIFGKAAYGVLTSALASGAALPSIDTVNSLAVDLTASGGALSSGAAADVATVMTLCYVDGEFLSYRTATLTGPNAYTLSSLGRGAFDSPIPVSHPAGAPFVRCDSSQGMLQYPFPQASTGQTLYFKLPAFNLFGRALQDISAATQYTHTVDARVQDPLRSILRVNESESADGTTATVALVLGSLVDHVQAYYRTVPITTAADQSADFSDTAVLPTDPGSPQVQRAVNAAASFTFQQPQRGYELVARLVPWYRTLTGVYVAGESVVFPVNAAPPAINVQLHATRSGNTASISGTASIGISDAPGSLVIIETVLGVDTTLLTVDPVAAGTLTLDPAVQTVLANRTIAVGVEKVTWRAEYTDVSGQTWKFGDVSALPALVAGSVAVVENPTTRQATITASLIDAGGYLNPAAQDALDNTKVGALTAHLTLKGVTTAIACTSIPASGTSGNYTFVINLDPTRPILVTVYRHYVDGSTDVLWANALDSNKISDVVNYAVVNSGTNANVAVQFDNDTKIGAGFARYSLDGGSTWTTGTVASDFSALFTGIARTSSSRSMILQGQNAIDGQWGNQITVQIDAYTADVPSLTATYKPLTSSTGQVIWTCTLGSVTLSIDGGTASTPSASPIPITLDGSTHSYAFVATLGSQSIPVVVTVPSLPGGGGTNGTFGTLTNVLHAAGSPGTVDFAWNPTNFDSSVAFRIYVRDDQRYGDEVYHLFVTTSAGAGTYTYTCGGTISTNHADPSFVIGFYVEAIAGTTIGSHSTTCETTYNHP